MSDHIRVMFDSVDVEAIPANAEMVATYANGRYATDLAAVARRFPAAQLVRVNVTGDPGYGDCLDVERYDATPADIAPWARARAAKGIGNLAVYCDRSTLPAVLAVDAGVPLFHWVATLDGTLNIANFAAFRTPAAVQFATAGGVDVSLVYEPNWHPAP